MFEYKCLYLKLFTSNGCKFKLEDFLIILEYSILHIFQKDYNKKFLSFLTTQHVKNLNSLFIKTIENISLKFKY